MPSTSDGMPIPRMLIAALRGGSGKTILSVGIIAALNNRSSSVAPFKKGPDYIDAGWLALAADRPCYNLDSFLLTPADNFRSFLSHSAGSDMAVIEGNRGLYDGIDREGSTSTAELAKLLRCPVVLCVDCTKITRTMAALVMGCTIFDPDVRIEAVILNRVANRRHEKKLRDSIEHYCKIPVIGAIPRMDQQHFPERHLGLVPTQEHVWAREAVDIIAKIAEQHLDLDALVKIAQQAPVLKTAAGELNAAGLLPLAATIGDSGHQLAVGNQNSEVRSQKVETYGRKPASANRRPGIDERTAAVRIGIIRDSAFQFYYPENIEALSRDGVEIVFISPLKDREMLGLELDALYIGGGFPETHAEQLAGNQTFNRQLKALVEDGFPIYAECGGLMYLGEELLLEGKPYPMVGILPVAFDFYKKPQGHGYTILSVEGENPYYAVGTVLRGHEFHYSRVSHWTGSRKDLVFKIKRGVGIDEDRDGILYKNVLATYTHVHAAGTPAWAEALIRNAFEFKASRR